MEDNNTLSNQAYEQAAVHGLGKPLSEYPPQSVDMKKALRIQRLTALLVWLIMSAMLLGFSFLIHSLTLPIMYTPDLLTNTNTIVDNALQYFLALMPVVFGLLIIIHLRLAVRRLVVCTDGMLTLRGKNVEATTWEQITALQLRIATNQTRSASNGPTLFYRIKRSNGSPIRLDAARGALVEAQYIEACAPTLLAQYSSGAPLLLGKLGIDLTGLTFNTRTLFWQEIEAVRVLQNPPQLNVFQKGHNRAWAKLRARDVPCLALVGRIIEQIQSGQDARA